MTTINRLLGLVAVAGLLGGCATPGIQLQSACDVKGATLVQSTTLSPSSAAQDVRFVAPDEGSVCVRLTRTPRVDTDSVSSGPLILTSGSEPRLNAFNGGGVTSEFTLTAGNWAGNRLYLRSPGNGQSTALRLRNPDYSLGIDIFELPGGLPPFEFDPGTTNVTLPPIECSGRLRGFRPLDNFDVQNPDAYPVMRRPGVEVICSALYTNSSVIGNQEIVVTSEPTTTDSDGRYSVTIPERTVSVVQSGRPPIFQKLVAACLVPEQCGHEAGSVFVRTLEMPEAVDPPAADTADVVNVLDIVSEGPVFDPDSGSNEPEFLLGARLITKGQNPTARNDKPFIIHEQIDVFNAEHSNFLLWGFSGQPFRINYRGEDGKDRSSDPRTEPCNVDPVAQFCVNSTPDCNPTTCDNPGHGCLEEPLIPRLLDAGYDVWLVDHLRGEVDVARIAAAAPLLYQRILNYGGLDGLLPQIPALDPDKVATFLHDPSTPSPTEAVRKFEHHVLRVDPQQVVPLPVSGDRRAIVSGYSLGGVIARMGLRLWEIRDELPNDNVRDFYFQRVTVAESPQVALQQPDKKIALYLSLDAPHRGVHIPVTLQAYVKRVNRVIENIPELTPAEKAQVSNANFELNAIPTRQIMQQEIAFRREESLGCWTLKPRPKGCRVRPFAANVLTRVDDQLHEAFVDTWTNNVNSLGPVSRDGLPATIPSVSISNGNLDQPRSVQDARVMNLKFDLSGANDVSHRLCDEFDDDASCRGSAQQAAGSQWNNSCQRINSLDVEVDVFRLHFGGWGSYQVFGLDGIDVSFPMRAEFSVNGSPVPNTGFPTIVPSDSSLLLFNGQPSPQWRDALWQSNSEYHTNVSDRMCKTILFYADGALTGDGDGWPACTRQTLAASCKDGGRYPGGMRGVGTINPDRAPCDCAPGNANIHPGASDTPGNGIDENCDGADGGVQPF